MLDRIVAVEARAAYRTWIRFEDGLEGELSLADLVGRGRSPPWEPVGTVTVGCRRECGKRARPAWRFQQAIRGASALRRG